MTFYTQVASKKRRRAEDRFPSPVEAEAAPSATGDTCVSCGWTHGKHNFKCRLKVWRSNYTYAVFKCKVFSYIHWYCFDSWYNVTLKDY